MKKVLILLFPMNLLLSVLAQNNLKTNNFISIANDGDWVIEIENTLGVWRKDEVIELDWPSLIQKNAQIMSAPFVMENSLTGERYPYQVINDEAGKRVKLLVQATLAPGATIYLVIKKGTPGTFKTKTLGRYVPERKDDFAWENDKIAFRMYGPALQATGEVSNGIDVWVKRTPEMIIDKWYKLDNYHTDHGEGMDCYKVGPTLGAGGIAPFANGKLYYSKNWAIYKVIFSGTLRTVFELTYQPWTFNGIEITETKRITLNAGSQLNQVEVTYDAKGLDTISVAIGIVKQNENGVIVMNEKSGFISYWEPSGLNYGTIGIGIIIPNHQGMAIIENHIVAFAKVMNKKPLRYFQGACWDRAGEIKSEDEWTNYLKEFLIKVQTPLIIN